MKPPLSSKYALRHAINPLVVDRLFDGPTVEGIVAALLATATTRLRNGRNTATASRANVSQIHRVRDGGFELSVDANQFSFRVRRE